MNIGVSACLLGECCTYKGENHLISELLDLDDVHFIKVCPEVMGGLTIPRDPCEIMSYDPLKIVSINGEDRTEPYLKGSYKALELFKQNHVEVALLKYKSPSCSCDQIYDGTFSGTLVDGRGVFAYLCQMNQIMIFHEKQLNEFISYIKKRRL